MFDFYLNYLDGRRELAEATAQAAENAVVYEMRHNYPFEKIASVDIVLNKEWIPAGTEGFYLLPGGWGRCKIHECALGRFRSREDTTFHNIDAYMPILGLTVGGGDWRFNWYLVFLLAGIGVALSALLFIASCIVKLAGKARAKKAAGKETESM